MEDKGKSLAETSVGEMRKRRETMPDGKRYIIYYTFGAEKGENSESVTENQKAEEASENV